ncbi:hypothetical protein Tco_0695858, partial [Tanacetum coccineum]
VMYSSTVTYTSVYTDSEPRRVFWGADEEMSDGGNRWVPTGRKFSMEGTMCPITKITPTAIVPIVTRLQTISIPAVAPQSTSMKIVEIVLSYYGLWRLAYWEYLDFTGLLY